MDPLVVNFSGFGTDFVLSHEAYHAFEYMDPSLAIALALDLVICVGGNLVPHRRWRGVYGLTSSVQGKLYAALLPVIIV